jgi:hypothetical protein
MLERRDDIEDFTIYFDKYPDIYNIYNTTTDKKADNNPDNIVDNHETDNDKEWKACVLLEGQCSSALLWTYPNLNPNLNPNLS